MLRTAACLGRALAIYGILSWRRMLLTRLGRTGPAWPAEVFFTEVERRFMARYAKTVRRDPPPTLEAAVRLVALQGGYLNRSRDVPRTPNPVDRPGTTDYRDVGPGPAGNGRRLRVPLPGIRTAGARFTDPACGPNPSQGRPRCQRTTGYRTVWSIHYPEANPSAISPNSGL